MGDHNDLTAVRDAIANLADEQVRALIETFVGGVIHGLIGGLGLKADDIVRDAVDNICGQLATLTDLEVPATEPEPSWPAGATAKQRAGIASCHAQDATTHVCEVCGREGTRRYVQTDTGWRCAPSATKCRRHQATQASPTAPPVKASPPAPAPAPDPKPAPKPAPKPTPTPPPAIEVAQLAESLAKGTTTAQCTACPRTWTLTGRVLNMAVDTHELKTGHIVDITEPEEGNP